MSPVKSPNTASEREFAILFVCLGNICRSPLAEGIFRKLVEERGLNARFLIDSCGTGHWHVGAPPHRDSVRVAQTHGVSLAGQRARQLEAADFTIFSHIFALDRQNLCDIEVAREDSGFRNEKCTVQCLRNFDPELDSLDVPDPYYGGSEGFEVVYQIIHRSCVRILDDLLKEEANSSSKADL